MSIFVLMKMASVHRIAGSTKENEDVFQRVCDISDIAYADSPDQMFSCKNTLFKHYLEHDVDSAVSFGSQLREDKSFYSKIKPYNQHDLNFSLGTAMALEGTMTETAIGKFETCLDIE